MTNTQPPSLRRNLAQVAIFASSFLAVAAALVSLYFAGVVGNIADDRSQSELGETADSIRPPVTTSPAYVLDQHADRCWTIDQQAQHLPSAAIVQDRDGTARWTADPVEVDAAFSEVLNSIGFDEEPVARRFDVIALCDR